MLSSPFLVAWLTWARDLDAAEGASFSLASRTKACRKNWTDKHEAWVLRNGDFFASKLSESVDHTGRMRFLNKTALKKVFLETIQAGNCWSVQTQYPLLRSSADTANACPDGDANVGEVWGAENDMRIAWVA